MSLPCSQKLSLYRKYIALTFFSPFIRPPFYPLSTSFIFDNCGQSFVGGEQGGEGLFVGMVPQRLSDHCSVLNSRTIEVTHKADRHARTIIFSKEIYFFKEKSPERFFI
jgi:hypothetical protein